jgi:hypothetical protein
MSCPPSSRRPFTRTVLVTLCAGGLLMPSNLFGVAPGSGRAAASPVFVDGAAAAGLAFTHTNGATGKYYMPELMGSGVALFDYDNDGDLDVFFVQSVPLDAGARGQTCRLFRNDLAVRADGTRSRPFHRRHRRVGPRTLHLRNGRGRRRLR